MPDVSIAVLAFNSAAFVDRALRSCRNQATSGLDIEIIVIDDGSTDDTQAILSKFDGSIIVKTFRENQGVGAASQAALSLASGKYFLRVDSDDFLSAFAVEFLFSVARFNDHASFFFTDYYLVDDRGFKEELVRRVSLQSILTHGAGILWETRVLRDAGGYDQGLRDCEDYDLLARIILAGHCGIRIPVPLYRYRRHSRNLTGRPERTNNVLGMEQKYAGIQNRASQIYWGADGGNR